MLTIQIPLDSFTSLFLSGIYRYNLSTFKEAKETKQLIIKP